MKFSSNQFLRIIQMRTREAVIFAIEHFCLWLCTLLILITTFSTSIIAIFLKYRIFHWNSFFLLKNHLFFGFVSAMMNERNKKHRHTINIDSNEWKRQGKNNSGSKMILKSMKLTKAAEVPAKCHGWFVFPPTISISCFFLQSFFRIETMNQPF